MTLTFDSTGAWNYLVICLTEAADEVMKSFYGEISGAGTGGGLSGKALSATERKETMVVGSSMIIGQFAFYADAIVESYGTGSLADTGEHSFWNEYAAQKGASGFNPSRTTKYIVGRPRGSYADIWGKRHSTWGKFEGVNLEGIEYFDEKTGQMVKIEPIAASYAIQNAEAWFLQHEGIVALKVSTAMEKWTSELGRFWKYK